MWLTRDPLPNHSIIGNVVLPGTTLNATWPGIFGQYLAEQKKY
jgi:hypothetical protein